MSKFESSELEFWMSEHSARPPPFPARSRDCPGLAASSGPPFHLRSILSGPLSGVNYFYRAARYLATSANQRTVVGSWRCYPSSFDMTGNRIGRQLSLATRQELIQAIAERYHSVARQEKKQILDEFIKVTGYHRKHAVRPLKRTAGSCGSRHRDHDLTTRALPCTLTILREGACRKRGP